MQSDTQWFVPKSQLDKPEDQQARYKIRGLIGTEAMDVNFHTDDSGRTSMTARGGAAALRAGLLDWENRTPGFDSDPRHWKANIDALDPMDALALAVEIWNRTFLTGEARKN
jgi:hypothetical protein